MRSRNEESLQGLKPPATGLSYAGAGSPGLLRTTVDIGALHFVPFLRQGKQVN